tara:strand:- start:301 stop:1713 length:1413 start_codon:yes stop_codon:yes gene_type:complete
MLRDLEELLLRIKDAGARDYMREAIRCYHGGAYRAAVVIAVAAGMDDLREKLASVASSGVATADVKAAHKQIDQLFREQKAFEGSLLDQALKIDLITPSEESKLRLLLKTRHLCGHPSGHSGSAEEAREVIASLIDLVLSRPPMLGLTAVTSLVKRVVRKSFFTSSGDKKVQKICREELVVIDPSLYPALVAKLVALAGVLAEQREKLGDIERITKDDTPLKNVSRVLKSLIGTSELKAEVWKRINALVEKPSAEKTALQTLSGSDGAGLRGAPVLHRMRALALVRRNLKRSRARTALNAWYVDGALTDEEVEEVEVAARDLAREGSLSPTLATAVFDLPWTGAVPSLIERLVEGSGSSTFDLANSAIEAMQALTEAQAEAVSPAQRVTYLKNVAMNGVGHYPAYEARDLVKEGLGSRTSFGEALEKQLARDADMVLDTDVDALVKLLKRSGLKDLAKAVLEADKAETDD